MRLASFAVLVLLGLAKVTIANEAIFDTETPEIINNVEPTIDLVPQSYYLIYFIPLGINDC